MTQAVHDETVRRVWIGYALIATAALLWALIGPLSTELFEEDVEPRTIAFWRAAIAGTLFLAHGVAARSLVRPSGRQSGLLAAFGIVGVAVFYVALPEATDAGGVGLAAILLYSAPLFVAVGSRVVFGDVLDRRRLLPVLATTVGVALVAIGAGGAVERPGPAIAWGLLSGLTYSSYYLVGRLLGADFGPAATYAVAFPVGAVLLAFTTDITPGTGRAWILLATVGVASTYLAYLCFATGLRRVDPTRASVVATLEPVAATALGAALYDERLGFITLVGGAIVVTAAGLSTSGGRVSVASIPSSVEAGPQPDDGIESP